MSLGLWGRLLVAGIGLSIVIFSVIVVTCFVHPLCCGYGYLERALRDRERKKKEKKASADATDVETGTDKDKKSAAKGQSILVAKTDYVIYQQGNDGPEKKKKKKGDPPAYQVSGDGDINLKCAPFSVHPVAAEESKPPPAELRVKLAYKILNGDTSMGRLAVHVIEANSLPYREYFTSLEPFLVLDVINSKWSVQKSERIVHSVQSRVVRHTYNPKFDQTFLFDVKRSELKDWCLKFTVFDKDRLTRKTPLCEKRVHVRDVKDLLANSEVLIETELQEVRRELGELLFGLSYLPTAQRLSISIVKAAGLKFLGVVSSLGEFYPYVRVLMLNAQGKCLKKKKTSFRHAEDGPVFNETVTFDLPVSQLEHAVFVILLCTKTMGKRWSTDGSLTDGEGEPQSMQFQPSRDAAAAAAARDDVLGAIVVGRNVKCAKGRQHWLMVMQNPRKIISVWHSFR